MRRLALLLIPLPMLMGQGPPRTESFWEKVLSIAGISKTSASVKDDAPIQSGEVWTVRLSNLTLSQLTAVGGYRSPVFTPAGDSVLALSGTNLVRIPLAEPDPVILFAIPRIVKLVGFAPADPNSVLALFEEDRVGMLNLSTRAVTWLEHNSSGEDQEMVNSLKQWQRDYGNACLLAENREESRYPNVYLRNQGCDQGQARETNVSHCRVVSCGQPSLSYDGKRVVFVRDLK
jgi:hypothetical protein